MTLTDCYFELISGIVRQCFDDYEKACEFMSKWKSKKHIQNYEPSSIEMEKFVKKQDKRIQTQYSQEQLIARFREYYLKQFNYHDEQIKGSERFLDSEWFRTICNTSNKMFKKELADIRRKYGIQS